MRARIIREGMGLNHLQLGANCGVWMNDEEMLDLAHDLKTFIFKHRLELF